jgi:hypothetical protein
MNTLTKVRESTLVGDCKYFSFDFSIYKYEDGTDRPVPETTYDGSLRFWAIQEKDGKISTLKFVIKPNEALESILEKHQDYSKWIFILNHEE